MMPTAKTANALVARAEPPRPGRIQRLFLAALLALSPFGIPFAAAATPTIKVGILKFGTVNWEMAVIRRHHLDHRYGVAIKPIVLANKNATAVALQSGAVDIIVTDWIWVSRRRAAGADYTFVPYSADVGGLMVRPDSGIHSLADLKGKKIGVAGGPVDKNWLILRAYGEKKLGVDLAKAATPVFAAPPLLSALIKRGQIPAVLNFWSYDARLAADGMVPLVTVSDMLPALGIKHRPPLLGWVFSAAWAAHHEAALQGFLRASDAAKAILAHSNSEWQELKPLTHAKNEATLVALRDAYRRGIVSRMPGAEVEAAQTLYRLVANYGGRTLTKGQTELAPGTFWSGPMPRTALMSNEMPQTSTHKRP